MKGRLVASKIARLGTASRGSGDITGLGVCGTLLSLLTLDHHLLEIDITTSGVLVPVLSRVVSRGIGAVTFESFKWVEVHWRTGLVGVPAVVHFLLGLVIPKLIVVLSVTSEKLERSTCTERSRGKGRSGGHQCEEGNNLGVLLRNGEKKVRKSFHGRGTYV